MKLEIISKYPAERPHPTPLLFIHGMFLAASCWDAHFLDYFAHHGYAAHAVSLRGHGKSEGQENLRWTRVAEFVDDVASAAKQLPTPPIVIGHSLGGFVVQKYLEEHVAPAAVLLSSPSPVGLLPTALRIARRHPFVFIHVNLARNLQPVVASPALVREAFFSPDFPDEQLTAFWKQMEDESYRAFLDMVALDLPRPRKVKTRIFVLGVAGDNMLSAGDMRASARAYGARCETVADVAHNSMLELRWQGVADRILDWLGENNF